MAIPKVAAIHDLSGLGKCSLTAAIPILAVCGVQAVPMPTAVLSNQTAFESYTGADLSIYMPMIAEEWKKRRAEFQGIFTGYLSSEQEVKWVEGFIDEFRKEDTLILVDPVLGDEGKFYRGFGDEMCCAMRNLCKKADVITPNLTEALFLLGKDAALAEQGEPLEIVEQYAKELSKLGPSTVIITGIHQGENIWNVGFDAANKECFSVSTRKIGEGYSLEQEIFYRRLSADAWFEVKAPIRLWKRQQSYWKLPLQKRWRMEPIQTKELRLNII